MSRTSWGTHWQASISHRGKRHYLGTFASADEAALAYDAAARQLLGEKARLNFSEQDEQ